MYGISDQLANPFTTHIVHEQTLVYTMAAGNDKHFIIVHAETSVAPIATPAKSSEKTPLLPSGSCVVTDHAMSSERRSDYLILPVQCS